MHTHARTYTHTHTHTNTHIDYRQATANVMGLKYIEVSARSGDNVERMFNIVIDGVLEHRASILEDVNISLTSESDNVDTRSGCCCHC